MDSPSSSTAQSGDPFHGLVPCNYPASQSNKPWDIFINHCGKDVKHTLANSLHHNLSSLGFHVFLDKDALDPGDSFPAELRHAIATATLHVAIFSPNYAHSPWCLAELSFMLKTRAKIIPIFYHVDPSDLRWIDQGKYATAFSELESKGWYTKEQLAEWKWALCQVSFLHRYPMNDNRDEATVVKNVVNYSLQVMRNGPLYNRNFSSFEKCSFICDVGEAASKDALCMKQKMILDDHVDEGKVVLENAFVGLAPSYSAAQSMEPLNIFISCCRKDVKHTPATSLCHGLDANPLLEVRNLNSMDMDMPSSSSTPTQNENAFVGLASQSMDPLDVLLNPWGKKVQPILAAAIHFVSLGETTLAKALFNTSFSNVRPFSIWVSYLFNTRTLFYDREKESKHTATFHLLELRDPFLADLQHALATATLHVAIFSPNYAHSPLCLIELSLMLKAGVKIIPIFLNVNPSDLRWIKQGKGKYAIAFSELESKGWFTKEQLAEWKWALYG